MIFDFQKFIQDLRDNPEKKEVVEKYEKLVWNLDGHIQDQIWYKEYIYKFWHIAYKTPEEITKDFDWNLLMQMVASSFSSDGLIDLDADSDMPEFVISVQSGDQVVVKKVTELRGFQVLRLYEIYSEEQMNLQILIVEDEKEKEAILAQREARFNRWKLVLESYDTSKLKQQEAKEKSGKLDDLYSSL
jgi:hypothetical protein